VGNHKEDEEVLVELDLKEERRISGITIKWSYSPLMFALEIEED
jgi:hypothetical protein